MNSSLDGPAADQRVTEQECSGCQYILEEIERRNALVVGFERTHDCRFAEITREGTAALIDDWHAHVHRDHINEHFDAENPTSVYGRDCDAPPSRSSIIRSPATDGRRTIRSASALPSTTATTGSPSLASVGEVKEYGFDRPVGDELYVPLSQAHFGAIANRSRRPTSTVGTASRKRGLPVV
jgi:hypothetical protein